MTKKALSTTAIVFVLLAALTHAGEGIQLNKRVWIAGEPITVTGDLSDYQLILDGSICTPRGIPVGGGYNAPQTGGAGAVSEQKADKRTVNISRVCDLNVEVDRFYGEHTVCYGSDCASFQIVRPSGIDALAFDGFPKRLRDIFDVPENERKSILSKYPTSTYSAHLLYYEGRWQYDLGIGAHKGADHAQEGRHEQIYQNILAAWEPMRANFPEFVFREDLLLALGHVYLHGPEPGRGRDVLQQLVREFPNGKSAAEARRLAAEAQQ